MKTIAVDCRMIRHSGIGTYLRAVLRRLIAIKHYRFNLIGGEAELSAWLGSASGNVSIIDCKAPLYGLREQWELWRKIPKSSNLYWSPHYIFPLLYRGKLLVTVPDIGHIARPDFFGLLPRTYARFMLSILAKKAAKVIAISEFTKSELIKYTKINGADIQVIHLGHPEIPDIDYAGHKKDGFILYVGNVKPHKNLRRVIEAHAKIFPHIPTPLIIVGKKSGFITGDPAVADYIKSIPSERVSFTGFVNNRELAGYYRGASMLVFASLYEGFGLPPLEAMSYGVPVLASNAASIPEVCGDAVLYCDPYSVEDISEKMRLVLLDIPLRNELIQRGKERVKLFSWDKTSEQHLDIMEQVMDND